MSQPSQRGAPTRTVDQPCAEPAGLTALPVTGRQRVHVGPRAQATSAGTAWRLGPSGVMDAMPLSSY